MPENSVDPCFSNKYSQRNIYGRDLHIDSSPTEDIYSKQGLYDIFQDVGRYVEQPVPVPVPRHKQQQSDLVTTDARTPLASSPFTPPLPSSTLSPCELAGSAPVAVESTGIHPRTPMAQSRQCCSLATLPQPRVSPSPWDHLDSPAASVLASFALLLPLKEEEQDEIVIDDDYVLQEVIGHGGFSVVRRGYCISSGEKVAIKVLDKSTFCCDREISIWRSLQHRYILRMHKVVETDTTIYIMSDYCPGGSLLDYLKKRNKLTESEARRVFLRLCEAVAYLHDKMRVCHKDLKLENVLLDEHEHVKLCDFGLAMPIMATLSDADGGSLAYAAPEQIRKSQRSVACPKTDLWSLGVILYALTVGHLPFQDDYDPRLQQKILSGVYEIPSTVSEDLADLVRGLLTLDPAKRFTMQQVFSSAWCRYRQL